MARKRVAPLKKRTTRTSSTPVRRVISSSRTKQRNHLSWLIPLILIILLVLFLQGMKPATEMSSDFAPVSTYEPASE